MPFANEHACRLRSPEGCDRFRRENSWQEHEGKRIDAIWCIADNEVSLQAMRYPKDVWEVGEARRH